MVLTDEKGTSPDAGSPSGASAMSALRRPAVRVALVVLGLVILAAIVLGPYVRKGGFAYDDWSLQARIHYTGFGGLVSYFINDIDPQRPLEGLYFAVVHGVLGLHQHLYMAWAALAHLAVAIAVFLVLRELGAGDLSAAGAAVLTLLFPFSDATWLWDNAAQASICALLWLLGLLAALRGLRAERRQSLFHVCSLVLYAASFFIYELSLAVVLLSGATYFAVAPRSRALRWWITDLAVLIVLALLFTFQLLGIGNAGVHPLQTVSGSVHHVGLIANQGLTVGASALVPFGQPDRWLVLGIVALVVAVAATLARGRREPAGRRELLRPFALVGGGLVVTIAGWALLVPAVDYYSPDQLGVGNRINEIAGIGLAVFVVGVARMLGAVALGRGRDRARPLAAMLAAALVAVVAVGYAGKVATDRDAWESATSQRLFVLAALRVHVPRLPPNATLIATGFPLWAAPGVPVFGSNWDLDGAVNLLWGNYSLRAWPAPPGSLVCGPDGVVVNGVTNGAPAAAYGNTVYDDVATGTATEIRSAAECRAAARSS